MSTTVGIQLEFFAGNNGAFLIFLKNEGTIINSGGDTLTEIANGYFEAEISETLSNSISYEVVVTLDGSKIYGGWLLLNRSNTVDDPGTGQAPVVDDTEIDLTTFGKYGPKRVKTPNLEIEQFSPSEVAKAEQMARTSKAFCDSHICQVKRKEPTTIWPFQ